MVAHGHVWPTPLSVGIRIAAGPLWQSRGKTSENYGGAWTSRGDTPRKQKNRLEDVNVSKLHFFASRVKKLWWHMDV